MDLEIKQKNGYKYKLSDFGFRVKDIVIESPEIEDNYETKENTSGRMLLSSQYRKRKITVPCFVTSTKLNDIPRLRDKFYDLTVNTEPVWIRELRYAEPQNYRFIQPTEDDFQSYDDYDNPIYDHNMMNDNYYTSGKQYQVKCSSVITPENKGKLINFDLVFETIEIPFAESIGTSLELENKPNKALWSDDMIVPFDEESSKRIYTFTNCWNNTVYYHGNVPNNEFKLYKKVTIVLGKSVSSKDSFLFTLGKSDYMKISNINLKKGDKIVYDGVQTWRNGTPINHRCSNAQPKFYPGWNNFTFNQQIKSVTFDMKFYYK
ncbi:phage tail family protein [Staphylococcus epidermidis]|uniref:phage tail domain-containing protein n=1 Tax=Staphylococcus epidermidis TaxID=1282 RepID=UPI0038BB0E5C